MEITGRPDFSLPSPPLTARLGHGFQILFQPVDALADPAAVDFQFGFTGTRPADAARQTGKRRVLVRQARQQILELRQLYLDFSFAAVRDGQRYPGSPACGR